MGNLPKIGAIDNCLSRISLIYSHYTPVRWTARFEWNQATHTMYFFIYISNLVKRAHISVDFVLWCLYMFLQVVWHKCNSIPGIVACSYVPRAAMMPQRCHCATLMWHYLHVTWALQRHLHAWCLRWGKVTVAVKMSLMIEFSLFTYLWLMVSHNPS